MRRSSPDHILDGLFGGHVSARIERVRWRARVHVESRLDAHAQRNDRPLFHAHRAAPRAGRLVLAPIVIAYRGRHTIVY